MSNFAREIAHRPHFPFVILALLLPLSYVAQSDSFIEGVVLEAGTEKPLEGMIVTANSSSARTDSSGRFKIAVGQGGRYLVAPARDGFVYSRPAHLKAPREAGVWVQLAPGESVSGINMRMAREGVIAGRVVDSNGKTFPAVSGSVRVLRFNYDEYGKRALGPAAGVHVGPPTAASVGRMDDRGNFRLYGLQPGDYYLSFSLGGVSQYFPGTTDPNRATPIHVGAGEEVQIPTVTLPAAKLSTAQIHFRMTYLDGKPQAAGASHSFGLSGIMNTDHFFAVGQFRTNRAADMLQDPTFVLPVAEGPYEVLVYSANQAELHYARFRLNVGNADSDQDVQLKRGVRVTGQISIEDPAGVRAAPSGLRCQLHSVDGLYARSVGGDSCLEREYTLGLYELEVLGMPPDAYVASALANGIDVLEKGLQLESSTELNIRLRPLGKILDGVVNDVSGAKLADAVVVLVPDPPLRSAGLRYRTAISDVNGKFELRGIAPGSYHLFAWTELEGAAYRNADFMKDFEGKGVPIKVVEGIDGLSQNITPLP